MCKSTYCIFEREFRGNIVQFINSEGGEVETTAMTLLDIPLVIILLVGCKIKKKNFTLIHTSLDVQIILPLKLKRVNPVLLMAPNKI